MKRMNIIILLLDFGWAVDSAFLPALSRQHSRRPSPSADTISAKPLEGRKGVVHVDKGWRDWREINTGVFDPERIGIKEMEQALKQAGTYKETLAPATDKTK